MRLLTREVRRGPAVVGANLSLRPVEKQQSDARLVTGRGPCVECRQPARLACVDIGARHQELLHRVLAADRCCDVERMDPRRIARDRVRIGTRTEQLPHRFAAPDTTRVVEWRVAVRRPRMDERAVGRQPRLEAVGVAATNEFEELGGVHDRPRSGPPTRRSCRSSGRTFERAPEVVKQPARASAASRPHRCRMTEPRTSARATKEILPGIHHWSVKDDRIGNADSDAYAIVDNGRVVLIDPLPIAEAALRALGEVEAIVLTAGNHQRSAWRFRKAFGAPIYAPEGAHGMEDEADHSFSGGDLLPGRLAAFHAPGPCEAMYALWRARPTSVVFLSDLLVHGHSSGRLRFVAAEYQDEPARTRASVRRILDDIPMTALCLAHGPPVLQGAREALRKALDEDDERLPAPPG